jgi:hypothetical protein
MIIKGLGEKNRKIYLNFLYSNKKNPSFIIIKSKKNFLNINVIGFYCLVGLNRPIRPNCSDRSSTKKPLKFN